ncbi:Transcription-repair-coupling factor [Azospirillaceae bacterium]
MIRIDLSPNQPGHLTIGGAPDGYDARILVEIAKRAGAATLLHVALDDARAARLTEALAFFQPDLEILHFPAWDCLPYDRVSPNPSIVSARINALCRLLETVPPGTAKPRVILTTVNALLQRVLPRSALKQASFTAAIGQTIDLPRLQRYFVHNGYSRAQTVREPGEYAVRGGIIDLFPPGADEPLRLDLFDQELEAVRSFDPLTQRTTEKRDRVQLRPMAELFLDEPSISRFRAGYRELFGAATSDPLYEAVSAARRHAGMEHWLPLFHDRLEFLTDYAPRAVLTFDDQVEQSRDARLAQINDFYQSRLSMMAAEKKIKTPSYKPLPPNLLYLDSSDWTELTSVHAIGQLSPFATPPGIKGTIDAGGRRGHDFSEARSRPDLNVFDAVRDHITALRTENRRVVIAGYSTGSRDRLTAVLNDHDITGLEPTERWSDIQHFDRSITAMIVLPIEHGFVSPDLAIITEQDILGDRLARPPRQRRRAANFIAEASGLSTGDLVVHVDHGIGRYDGLVTLDISGAPHDCLRLVYEGGDKLFVPVENIEVLTRYGSESVNATLDKLGGVGWQGRKARVKKRLKDMADALLRIAAARALKKGDVIEAPEGLYEEFSARFPYPETEDQLRAISDVAADMASGRPMDRLICGDVGFGKTEVALRAAFLVAMSGLQVAVMAPTTLLARQHHRSFSNRFAGLPVRIGSLSRLISSKESARVRNELADGTIDIVVGTHALLSKNVEFKRLGLVIIDEEQHFGVKQKERLKELRTDVHVLTLTATPIPRTLQMALSGVRELSLIATPPVDRLAVRTFVLPYDPLVIREAVLREHFRGGQTFFVSPRLEGLDKIGRELAELVPEVKVVAAHGQMASSELENVMTAFDDGQFEVLLSTNIIESGLDIPRANTMIIHRCDLFGLSQLYQLRGRVGRSKLRGYAYLTYSPDIPLSEISKQRLHVIETLDNLGAGFQLASHDMDIRGAGNLLGEEQSGHIREVGVELFQQMLDDAIQAARAAENQKVNAEQTERQTWTPQINLGMPVLIPEEYVSDLNIRLGLYRRIADLVDRKELDAFASEMIDRFGKLPPEVSNLLEVVSLKQLCRMACVERIDAGPKGAVLTFHSSGHPRPDLLVAFIAKQAGALRLRPDHKLVYTRTWDDAAQRLRGAKKLMKELATLANHRSTSNVVKG